MILRRLANCNEADWQQELEALGASASSTWRYHPGRIYLKWLGFSGERLSAFMEHLPDRLRPRVLVARAPHQAALTEWTPGSLEEVVSLEAIPDHFVNLSGRLRQFRQNWNRRQWEMSTPRGKLKITEPLIMGILNVTPDSFSDGGQYVNLEAALAHARQMMAEGAAIIDVGGESTRPGAPPVSAEEEWRRIGPVISELSRLECRISVDTYKSEVAQKAVEAGADIINDVSALRFDPHMAHVAAANQVPVVLMHMKGVPRTMQKNPSYDHLIEEIYTFLQLEIERAGQSGIKDVIIDPGIGFGKRFEDNFEILRRLAEFRGLGRPILLGASRKSFIGSRLDAPPAERLIGTVSANLLGVQEGANILRVHDVRENQQALKMFLGSRVLKA